MRAPTNMGIAPWNQRGLTNLERDRIRAAWAVKMNYRADHYRREVERLDALIQIERDHRLPALPGECTPAPFDPGAAADEFQAAKRAYSQRPAQEDCARTSPGNDPAGGS